MPPNPTSLYNPREGEPVPLGTFVYFRTRNRQRLWETIIDEFERAGISQAELHTRTGRDPARISNFLNVPGNSTADTVSDHLFAMTGAQLEYSISHPLSNAPIVQPARTEPISSEGPVFTRSDGFAETKAA